MEIRSIAVVGTGVVGASWAAFFAARGFPVRLPEETRGTLKQGLNEALNDRSLQDVADWRDEKLIGILKVIYGTNGV